MGQGRQGNRREGGVVFPEGILRFCRATLRRPREGGAHEHASTFSIYDAQITRRRSLRVSSPVAPNSMLEELLGFGVLSLWLIVPVAIGFVGLLVLSLTVVGAKAVRRRWIAGGLVISVIALVAVGDELLGRAYFDHLCSTEAGIRVHKRAASTFETPGKGLPGSPLAYRKSAIAAKFPYVLESVEDLPGPAKIYYTRESIRDARTGETLASATNYFYGGGWLQNAVSPHGAGGGSCGLEPNYFRQLVEAIFAVRGD